MPPVVSCVCGERLELPAGQPLTEADCPVCGRTVAIGPALSAEAPTGMGNAFGMETAAPAVAVVCPDCGGEGRCPICSRRKKSFWSAVMSFIDSGFDSLMSDVASGRSYRNRYGFEDDRSFNEKYVVSKVCVGCNGNRKCFKCRGTGTYTGE